MEMRSPKPVRAAFLPFDAGQIRDIVYELDFRMHGEAAGVVFGIGYVPVRIRAAKDGTVSLSVDGAEVGAAGIEGFDPGMMHTMHTEAAAGSVAVYIDGVRALCADAELPPVGECGFFAEGQAEILGFRVGTAADPTAYVWIEAAKPGPFAEYVVNDRLSLCGGEAAADMSRGLSAVVCREFYLRSEPVSADVRFDANCRAVCRINGSDTGRELKKGVNRIEFYLTAEEDSREPLSVTGELIIKTADGGETAIMTDPEMFVLSCGE